MVKKVAQRAIAAGLAGMMSFGAVAPAAMAIDGTSWGLLPWWNLSPTSDDDGLTFWTRIKGDTRYDTMKKIIEAAYTSDGKWVNAAEAVIASGDNFPDALAANGLAGTLNNGYGAPVILTKKGALSSQAKTILEKMQVQHVYIMGGTAAVSQDVENAISDMRIAVTRVAGADRQETSMKAFSLVSGNWYKNFGTHSVIIATGANYADALSIAPFAYQTGTPIVLTKSDGTLTDAQVNAIKDNDQIYNIIVVGGENAVKSSVFGIVGTFNDRYGFNYTGVRIDGADRYETSANIAEWEVKWSKNAYNNVTGKDQGGSTLGTLTNFGDCYFDWDFTFVATGENFPDALAGAQLAGGSYYNSRGTGYMTHTNKQGDREIYVSGSPILLTKDGDKTAESVIARNLAWNFNTTYAKQRELYANWFDYTTIEGLPLTPQQFSEEYLAGGFFTDTPLYPLDAAGNYTDFAGRYVTAAGVASPFCSIYTYDGTTAEDSNFHGVIFGGTAAVSKKKAESLDKAVKDTIWTWDDNWTVSESDYNDIMKTLLSGNVFYASKTGTPRGEYNFAPLTDYYYPATLPVPAADAAGVTYTQTFYHYSYSVDPITGISGWSYVGTIDAVYRYNENTGVMVNAPFFV
jgi:putative cell wall-binding protein